uniref:Uncharacterized protein n=1 Tax=Tetradesmus obliquus TaxID=3088 RepID=A0A383WGR4_TETOB|eukprot:jgi/Sobl393_1/2703/SZX76685.1
MPYKVKRPSKTCDIEQLSQALRLKLQELGQLEAENSQLSFRHNTLAATCDVLQLLGAVRNAGQPSSAEEELIGQLQALMPSLDLLYSSSCDASTQQQQQQQVAMQRSASSGAAAFGGWVDIGEAETLGTLQNPMRMLLHLLRSPTCSNGSSSANGSGCAPEGYAKMTLRQLQEDYQETVNQLAQHLSFMDNPFKRNQQGDANPFVNIKRLLSRHGCMLTQLVATGQEHLVPQFMMADCVTGQQQEQHNEALYEYALQRLELSAEQQQRIQATLMCFQGLLAAIVEERQAIQSELCPQGMPAGPGGSNGAAAPPAAAAAPAEAAPPRCDEGAVGARDTGVSSSPGSSKAAECAGSSAAVQLEAAEDASLSRSGSSSGSDGRSSNSRSSDGHDSTKAALSRQQQARREQQQQHQQRLALMFKLLKKESLLKCCCWVGVEGCMTYVQLAKLAVLCFPYPASPIALAQTLDRLLKQQQPQQQPQQRPAQTEPAQQQQ